jgi:hypothetical protein
VSPVVLVQVLGHGGWLNGPEVRGRHVDPTVARKVLSLGTSFRRSALCFLDILQRVSTPLYLDDKEKMAREFLRNIMAGLECGSTDPRDRIYAQLPLQMGKFEFIVEPNSLERAANELGCTREVAEERFLEALSSTSSSFSKLIVDYNRSVEDIYSSLVSYLVFATGSLNIISLCQRRSNLVTRTWTFDLTTASLHENDYEQEGGLLARSMLGDRPHKLFCASKGTSAEVTFTHGLSILSVKGFRIATVLAPMDRPEILGAGRPDLLTKKLLCRVILVVMARLEQHESSETTQRTLWNTMQER